MKDNKVASSAGTTRLVGRNFAVPLSEKEIAEVAGGPFEGPGFHPGPGTCTLNNDDD